MVPVVGVGASAGGLEAFTQLLRALPADTGMAFVLVQHLAPSHASALAEILSRATTMPVTEVEDEPTVEPNHVYVIPPGQSMVISEGTLNLMPREGRGAHHPVDMFFRALAEDRRHRAIAVVLSGTATDGTIGLAAIKAEGGITFAQDGSAQHQGMPRSAIASGCVDFVLPPSEIAREIVRIGRHPYSVPETQAAAPGGEPDLTPVIRELRRATGVDFTHYKFNTLNRRVTRRMLLRKIETLGDYVGLLQRNPEEVEALYHDVLINVTSFFRNPEAFETLKQTVLPRLIKDRSRSDPVRFWTLGCSTGQEAYSLAMAFAESADAAGSDAPLQVFATDLDDRSVETARLGVYSKDIAQDVSPERLRRFFVEVDGRYRINKSIRDVCVFSRHNALADPPFSRMDLISCRNLLIYLEPVLQQRIVPTLHYALKPAGFLWLGGSETIGGYRNLFEAADVKHKFYVKKPSGNGAHFPLQHGGAPREAFTPIMARPTGQGKDLYREADRLLLSKFAPPGVLVSADLDILQYRGDTGPYLAPAPGKASLNLLKMLREGLLVGVRAAIVRAGNEGAPTRQEGLTVPSNGGHREVAVEVIPIQGDGDKGRGAKSGGFLVLFEDAAGAAGPLPVRGTSAPSSPEPLADDRELARMAQELAATREYLQSVIEQQESANEELQSANEEAQSANEELQSVNEELETSKEELQSSNEELVTVNDELNNRNLELGRLNNDLVNLIGSTEMAIVMLGPDLRIRRFTPAAEKLLNLVPADLGRPIGAVRIDFDLPDLEPLLAEVVNTVAVRERDVRDKHGHWYSLRLSPYRTVENEIDGVVLVLVDVDVMKRANEYTASIVATVREPLVVLDADYRVRTANEAFYRTFDVKPEETEGRGMFELGNGHWNIPELRGLLEQVLPHDKEFNDFVVEQEFDHIGKRTMLLNARRLLQPGGLSPAILIGIKDVTGRGASEAAIRRLAAIVSSSEDAIVSKDLDGVITTWNRGAELLFGYSPEEAIGKSVTLLIPDDHVDEEPQILERIRRGEVIGHYETVRRRKDGSLVDVSLTVSPMRDSTGTVVGASKIARDITERKRLESELRQHAIDLSEADRRKNEFLAMLAHELRNPLAPIRNALTIIRLNGQGGQA
ncbi:MAG TPA: chemotaxis protein CheB, partial [Thermoanaerobaculia bacterium]|nr:chemotaxis protein CheB [Thermoanaerobaculia bacterium]